MAKRKKDEIQYSLIKRSLERGEITNFRGLVEPLNRTTLTDDARLNYKTFSRKSKNPGLLNAFELMALAQALNIDVYKLFSLVIAELETGKPK